MTNRILTKGFWNEQKIILKGFGRRFISTGTGLLGKEPKIPEIPAHKELRFEIRNPVEVSMQTNFELVNPVRKEYSFSYPMFSPLLKVNNFYYDVDLAVLMNKQLKIPLNQRIDSSKLINILKAI